MGEPLRVEQLKGAFLNMSDEEHDKIIEEMIRDGIIDRDGNVLKRFPEPPDWLTQANGRSRSDKPVQKTKRPRKRS